MWLKDFWYRELQEGSCLCHSFIFIHASHSPYGKEITA
jgi:hypothetical protein